MDEKHFKSRAYGLKELAMLYFPNIAPQSASNQLRRWMRRQPLMGRLAAAGYRKGQKILTPKQVALIADHVGDP